ATLTCTGTDTVDQADLDAGVVINHANGTATFAGSAVHSNTDTASVPAAKNPALSIDKSVTPGTYTTAGQSLSYSYLVRNTGNVTLTTPVTVADDRAATVTCPALSAGGLAHNATITCSATYLITQDDVDAGTVINTAAASSGTTTSPVDSATALASQDPQMHLDKSASPASYDHVGQTISYTYVLTNTANVTLSGPFAVSDDRVATVSCPAPPPPGTLVPGATLTCTGTDTVDQADLDAGVVINHATGTATFAGSAVHSNTDTASVPAAKNPALSIDKSVT